MGETPLVGRVVEMSQLVDLVRGAHDGRFGAVVVEGDAGIGKTSLVTAAVARAGTQALVLPGACLPLTSVAVPMLGLRSAVRRLPPEARPGFLGGGAGGVDGGPAAPVPVAFDDWLVEESRRRPVVLVVEDLHWADEETLDALMYVLAGPADRSLAVILTIRTSEVGAEHPLRGWLADARRLPGVVEVRLGPLDRDVVAEEVEAVLGVPAHTTLVDEVHTRSGGNPYFVRLLVSGLDPAARALPDHLPEELSAAVLRQWDSLSADARRLLVALAVSGRPAVGSALARVADVADLSDPAPPLHEAVAAGMLDVRDDGAYWFHHPLQAEALEQGLTPADRRVLHAGFAAGYEDDVEEGLTPDLAETISDHYVLADEPAGAYDWALIAADTFDAAGDVVGVLRMLRRAVDLHPETSDAAESLEELLEDLRLAAREHGAWEEELAAVEALLEVVDVEVDPLRVAVLETWRSMLFIRLGRGQAVENVEHAVELSAGHPGTWQRVVVLCEYSRLLLWAGETEAGRAAGLEALRYAEQGPRDPEEDAGEWDRARAYAFGQGLMIATLAGQDVDADDLVERAYEAAARQRDSICILHATFWHANLLSEYGPGWVAAHERGRLVLEEVGAPQASQAWLSAAVSADLFLMGEVETLRSRLRVALGSEGVVAAGNLARLTAAMVAAWQGRDSEAAAHLARAHELVPDPLSAPQFHEPTAAATVLLLGGDPEAALDTALTGMRAPGANFFLCEWLAPLSARALADLVQADLDAGRDPAPHRARLAAVREEFPHPLVDGDDRTGLYKLLLAGVDALYAAETARAGVLDDAAARWDRAATMLHDAGLPWDEAYARWRSGEALLAHGGAAERRAAAEHLRSGFALASRLGAEPVRVSIETVARSARVSLSEVAGPVTEGDAFGVLTRREREVVAHVVAGRTYAEIAAALFLSEKTVSSHISNILRKTGAANRVELASWAARTERSS